MGEEELAEAPGTEVSFFAEGDDAAAEGFFEVVVEVVGPGGAIEEGGAMAFGLGQAFFPFVEGFARDPEAEAGQFHISQTLGFLKPGKALADLLF